MPFIFGLLMKWFDPATIINGAINAYMKAKDVDLEKFRSANLTTDSMVAHIVEANVQYDQIKSQYALAVLQWWPFRLILFVLLAFCATRFALIVTDSTWWWLFGCKINGVHVMGDRCSWSIPPIKGVYGGAEMQFLLFFVVAKPIDTAVSGALGVVQRYLTRK